MFICKSILIRHLTSFVNVYLVPCRVCVGKGKEQTCKMNINEKFTSKQQQRAVGKGRSWLASVEGFENLRMNESYRVTLWREFLSVAFFPFDFLTTQKLTNQIFISLWSRNQGLIHNYSVLTSSQHPGKRDLHLYFSFSVAIDRLRVKLSYACFSIDDKQYYHKTHSNLKTFQSMWKLFSPNASQLKRINWWEPIFPTRATLTFLSLLLPCRMGKSQFLKQYSCFQHMQAMGTNNVKMGKIFPFRESPEH